MRSKDAGESLIEVVISVAVLGLSVIALISAVAAAANLSLFHRDSVDEDLAMRLVLEGVEAAKLDADLAGVAQKAVASVPGVSVSSVEVACLDPGPDVAVDLADAVLCVPGSPLPRVVTVTLTHDGRTTSTSMIKLASL